MSVVSAPTRRGPSGIGYLPGFVRRPETALLEYQREFGDVVYFRRGPLRGYLIFHPREIAYVLEENAANYPHGQWLVRKTTATMGRGVFAADGELWRRYRRLIEPGLDGDRAARFSEHMTANTAAMLDRWEERRQRGEPVDVVWEMEELSRTNAGIGVFGEDYLGQQDVLGPARAIFIRQSGRELTSPLGAVPLTVPLPFHRTFLAARASYDQTVARLVEQRRRTGATAGDDLLSALVHARDPETGATLDDREVRDQATTIYFLWKPVAITLAWVWYLLARNPSAAERLSDEVARSLGARDPALGDLASLPYTRAVVAEALRLHPPVLLLPREAAEDDELAGHPVPAGTRVAISAHVTHRHPEFWDEPERFEPERFLRPDERPAYAYFPFAEPGPRRCLGHDIAQTELAIVVAAIARRYRLELLPGERVATKMTVARDFTRGLRMRLAPA